MVCCRRPAAADVADTRHLSVVLTSRTYLSFLAHCRSLPSAESTAHNSRVAQVTYL